MQNNFEKIQDLLRTKAEYQARLNLIPYEGSIDIKEGFVHIKVLESSHDIQVVLETLEIMLDTIEESYSKYIKITKMEV